MNLCRTLDCENEPWSGGDYCEQCVYLASLGLMLLSPPWGVGVVTAREALALAAALRRDLDAWGESEAAA